MMMSIEIINAFNTICSTNGDDIAFHTTPIHLETSSLKEETNKEIGFTELNENVNVIVSELFYRHDILDQENSFEHIYNTGTSESSHNKGFRGTRSSGTGESINEEKHYSNTSTFSSSTSSSTRSARKEESTKSYYNQNDHRNISTNNHQTQTQVPPCVLIISSQPSPGEAAAVLACTKIRTPFVPLSMQGQHRISTFRIQTIIEETNPVAAIVVLSIDPMISLLPSNWEEDFESRPALSHVHDDITMIHLEENNEIIHILNKFGIHRIVIVNALDGTVIGPLSSGGGSSSSVQIMNEKIDSIVAMKNKYQHDVAYILYTSGSTSSTSQNHADCSSSTNIATIVPRPKAVIQTYRGIWNRIQWQWKTFPFIQQMKKEIGYNETIQRLDQDGMKFIKVDNNGDDVVMRRTSLSFVDSIAEIYGSLLAGVPLWCPLLYDMYDESIGRGFGLLDLLEIATQSGVYITRFTCIPSQLNQVFSLIHDKEQYKQDHESKVNPSKSNITWIDYINMIVVSGEPCPLSLVEMYESTMSKRQKALLVNLYGQTESSGDVSCLVVGVGGCLGIDDASSIQTNRFPHAQSFFWNKSRRAMIPSIKNKKEEQEEDQITFSNSFERFKSILVPCGKPIDGHKFFIKPHQNKNCTVNAYNESSVDCVGCLYVEGVGIARGYLNNDADTCKYFISANDNSMTTFNTMDLAFQDKQSKLLYIIGRAPEEDDTNDVDFVSNTVGKVNGVMIHVAEMENAFLQALKGAMSEYINTNQEMNLLSAGVLLRNYDLTGNQIGNQCAIFIDLSSFPKELIILPTNTGPEAKIINQEYTFYTTTFQKLFSKARSLMGGEESIYKCHVALIPNHIFLLPSMPKNGAAEKINRTLLVKLASSELNNEDLKFTKESPRSCSNNSCFTIRDIVQIYSKILRQELNETTIASTTFLELGGHSMMAIDAAHQILKTAKSKGMILRKKQIITAMDLFDHTVSSIYNVIIQGKDLSVEPKMKRQRLQTKNKHIIRSKSSLATNAVIVHDIKPYNMGMDIAWKLPMKMCVDSRPIVIPFPNSNTNQNIVVVGSQGGDFVLANASNGKVYGRIDLDGKIEGEMNFLSLLSQNDDDEGIRNRIIIFVCTYEIKVTSDQTLERLGSLHAFELISCGATTGNQTTSTLFKGSEILITKLWQHEVVGGELKNKPLVLSVNRRRHNDDQNIEQLHRIIIGSYDGSIQYLDAITGNILCVVNNRFAIHADMALSTMNDNTSSNTNLIVASSTWNGKVSCLSISIDKLNLIWEIEVDSPVYSTPLYVVEKHLIIIFAIDGSVRALNATNGHMVWKKKVTKRPIFSSGCYFINNDAKYMIAFGCPDGIVRCLELSSGDEEWVFESKSTTAIFGTPQYIHQLNQVIVATTSGMVCTINATTGMLNDAIKLGGEIYSSPSCYVCNMQKKQEDDTRTSDSCSDDTYFALVGCRDSCLYKIWL